MEVAAALGAFGGNQVIVRASCSFKPGINWFDEVHKAIEASDWLILLYTAPQQDWDWCMFEVGYFSRRLHESRDSSKRLICLHPQGCSVPNPIMHQTNVQATVGEVYALMKAVYLDDPWAIKQELFTEAALTKELGDFVNKIVSAVNRRMIATPREQVFAPEIMLEILPSQKPEWKSGRIPENAIVSGVGQWEAFFGKSVASGSRTWGDLIKGLNYTQLWIPSLIELMQCAEADTAYVPTLPLFLPVPAGNAYRLVLRKLEKMPDGSERFYLTVVLIPPNFDSASHDKLTLCHHLIALAWSFRWRVLGRHYVRIRHAAVGPASTEEIAGELKALLADIRTVHSESHCRGVDMFQQVLDCFDNKNTRETIMDIMQSWGDLYGRLEAECVNESPKLATILAILEQLQDWNKTFYSLASQQYSLAIAAIPGTIVRRRPGRIKK